MVDIFARQEVEALRLTHLHRVSYTTAYVVFPSFRFKRISSGLPFATFVKFSLLKSFEHSHKKMALETQKHSI